MSEYPEHDKMHGVVEASQAIGEFMEWLGSEGIHFATEENGRYLPTHLNIQTVLAQYFEIDLDEIEREKRRMLATQRNLNEVAS